MGGESSVGRGRDRAKEHGRKRGEWTRAGEWRGDGCEEAGERVLGCVETQRELALRNARTIRAGKCGFMRQK